MKRSEIAIRLQPIVGQSFLDFNVVRCQGLRPLPPQGPFEQQAANG